MSNPAGVESTLQRLERLRDAIAEFSVRERDLEAAYQQKLQSGRRRDEAAQAAEHQRVAAEIERAESSLGLGIEASQDRRRARASGVRDAQRTVRKLALERIDAQEGQVKFDVQREMLRATRERERAFAESDARHADFHSQLGSRHQTLTALDRQAHQLLGTFGRRFVRPLGRAHESVAVDREPPEDRLLSMLDENLSAMASDLERFQRAIFTRLVAHWPVWMLVLLLFAGTVVGLQFLGVAFLSYPQAGAAIVAAVAGGLILYWTGRRQAAPAAQRITEALGRSRVLHHLALEKCDATHQRERDHAENAYVEITQRSSEAWHRAVANATREREIQPTAIDAKAARAARQNERWRDELLARMKSQGAARVQALKDALEEQIARIAREGARRSEGLEAEHQRNLRLLEEEWAAETAPLFAGFEATALEPAAQLADAEASSGRDWVPAERFPKAIRIGSAEVDLALVGGTAWKGFHFAWPGPPRFKVPLLLTFPDQGGVLIQTRDPGRTAAIGTLNRIVLRLLATMPPGRLALTLFDPVGLGQSFAGLMHLSDEAEHLINGRIFTQTGQFEERLGDLSDHMEKVIQMYLRNEYATIAEYNEQAGNIAEKYHFLVIADFPRQFSDLALRRLLSVASNGPRCGVFTLIHWDLGQPSPPELPPAAFQAGGTVLTERGGTFSLNGRAPAVLGLRLELDPAPDPEAATTFIQRVARASIDSNRVEVPFAQVAPPESDVWTADTTSELRVPIGRTGATKLQYLAIGKGTRQHALIAGKTGSGKSTLFHVVITNLALWCSPEQVEFYLVDFKKGVEFKCYATHRLPHARVVAIESDREFGLSVLQRVDEELRRRGDILRSARVQDVAAYRRSGGSESLPRVLLVIDEFQELFVEEDRIAQGAAVLLDRIVRQGRAFGIHAILGSQTLGGAYTVARSTLGQMVIRIALQCNEADAFLIMDDNNSAPRLLSRPGEGIYNDTAGTKEGNSPFQAVWLPDHVRDARLRQIRDRADHDTRTYPGPLVFEGDTPADVRENAALHQLWSAVSVPPATGPRVWLGAPNSIKGPTEVVFERRNGSHLLLVGQRDDAILAILGIAVMALASQQAHSGLRLFVLDGSRPDSESREFWKRLVARLPNFVVYGGPTELESLMDRVAGHLGDASQENAGAQQPPVFLLIHGLQHFRKLRQEEEFGIATDEAPGRPAVELKELLGEGAAHGCHVIAACDTYAAVTRAVGRRGLADFGMRVLFQMSANDSASLIDSPNANRLGMHRALLYHEREGYLELFRPYALPDDGWFETAAADVKRWSR